MAMKRISIVVELVVINVKVVHVLLIVNVKHLIVRMEYVEPIVLMD